MKKQFLFFTGLLLAIISCKDNSEIRSYTYRAPVFTKLSVLRSTAITPVTPKPVSRPGKIYVYGNYLFVTEAEKGIHIINNENPASPQNISFIPLAGNVDIAVNSNILYADSYADLLAFDISSISNIRLVKRVNDVFYAPYADAAKTAIVTGYKDTTVTYTYRPNRQNNEYDYALSQNSSSGGQSQSYGQGGSMARFTLMNKHLYTVTQNALMHFDVGTAANPVYVNTINLNWGIETIFPYNNALFIGTNTGMHIFDAQNPSAPNLLSTYRHFTSCDPVVVRGNKAYVTLRSGNTCQQGQNQLDVLDIADLKNPKLIRSYQMKNPHGLAITANALFICEGQHGLKTLSVADSLNMKETGFIQDVKATDVIASKSLIVTGDEGIYQYDYSQPAALKLLSRIVVRKL